MENSIDRYQIKLNTFTADLDNDIDPDKRLLLTTEVDCYESGKRDNGDGTFNQIYRCKVVGSTLVKQGDNKPILAKSKRSASQRLRMAFNKLSPEEEFYLYMEKLINNLDEVIEFLKPL